MGDVFCEESAQVAVLVAGEGDGVAVFLYGNTKKTLQTHSQFRGGGGAVISNCILSKAVRDLKMVCQFQCQCASS